MKYLLDVNVLVALTEHEHMHHEKVMRWFNTPGLDWGTCALTEAGLLRLSANPHVGRLTVADANAILADLARHPGYRFWPITVGWGTLAAPFLERVYGHQQITDAYLLGLAVQEQGVLVTMDKAIQFLAGTRYSKHILVLE